MRSVILHCDLNNFYASAEITKDPSLKGKAIAVCGDPEKRHGIILAKSYPAKACGIKTGDTIWQAKQKCPDLILFPADFSTYMKLSDIVFKIYTRYTDMVEPFGMDECWLDVTGSIKLYGGGREIADNIRKTIREETGLTASVGVSFTKVFAKLGSDMKKPDATTIIPYELFKEILWDLPANELIMVGRHTAAKLDKINVHTIGELANADRKLIEKIFGINGLKLMDYANGIERENVRKYYEKPIPKSMGHSTTTPRDLTTREEVKAVILALSEQVAYRLRRDGFAAQGISVVTRDKNLEFFSRQRTLMSPTAAGITLEKHAMQLFDKEFSLYTPLRLVGVSAFNLIRSKDPEQLSLFTEESRSTNNLYKGIDSLREKYGVNIIKRGSLRGNQEITDIFDDEEFLPFRH